jgi:hypothetical protein
MAADIQQEINQIVEIKGRATRLDNPSYGLNNLTLWVNF